MIVPSPQGEAPREETGALPQFYGQTKPIDPERILRLMPALLYTSRGPVDEAPCEDYEFIFILHFLSDLIGFAHALHLAGMQWHRTHFFYKSYLYPHKERVATQLEGLGADVVPLEPLLMKRIVGNIIKHVRSEGRRIIIVEDGGYVVPLIHSDFQEDVAMIAGAVEQTTKGINESRPYRPLAFPLLSVAGARIKHERESPAVAEAVWRNVSTLLFDREPSRYPVVVVGYGSIGRNLADYLRRNGISVIVHDQDENKRIEAASSGYEVTEDLGESVTEPGVIVIGATGQTSIGPAVIRSLGNNAVLCSASSDQREIGLIELRRLSDDMRGEPIFDPVSNKKIGDLYKITETRSDVVLLAEGYPINFWDTESLSFRLSQVALAPLFLAALTIARGDERLTVGEPDSELVDELVEEAGILDMLA